MATPEATLRAAVLKRIREDYPPSRSGVLVFGRPAGPSTGPGHPDLFGVALGHFLALEIKRPKEQPTPLQVQRILDLRRAGAYAWIIRSTLDATRAVYQAKIGGRVPTQEDPIDFDDWFKSIASPEPATEKPASAFAETATKGDDIPPPDEDEPETPFGAAAVLSEDPDSLLSEQPEPSPAALAEMPEVDMTGARRGHYANQVATPADVEISALIRAIGDRVTEVWEAVNRIETMARYRNNMLADLTKEIIGMREVMNKLLTEIGMEDQIADPLPEPTPFDDVAISTEPEQAEPPKRTRGRPRKAS